MINKKKVKVSVIVPCYNAENYIKRCIDSILNQTFKDFELICVNDGSTDSTLEILKKYEKNNKNMLVVTKKNEGGRNVTMTGLKYISGEYVCVIDNDDYIAENYLEELYKSITKKDADIAICAFQREDFVSGKVYSIEMKKKEKTYNLNDDYGVLLEINTSMWNKMFKKNLILKLLDFRLDSLGFGDMTLLAYLYSMIDKISFNSNVLYYYQVREGSNINSMKLEAVDSIYDNLIRIRNYYVENNLIDRLEILDAYAFLHLGISLMYRIYCSHKKEFNVVLKKVLSILNNDFPNWKNNKYYSLSYILKEKRNYKLFICKSFYKLKMFKLFIKTYNFITTKFKFDIKW